MFVYSFVTKDFHCSEISITWVIDITVMLAERVVVNFLLFKFVSLLPRVFIS